MEFTFAQLANELEKLSYEDSLKLRDLVDSVIEKREAEEAMANKNLSE